MRSLIYCLALVVLTAGPALADSHEAKLTKAMITSHATINETNGTLRTVLKSKGGENPALLGAIRLQNAAMRAYQAGDHKTANHLSEQAKAVATGKASFEKIEATDYLSKSFKPKLVDRKAIDALELEPLPTCCLFKESQG